MSLNQVEVIQMLVYNRINLPTERLKNLWIDYSSNNFVGVSGSWNIWRSNILAYMYA